MKKQLLATLLFCIAIVFICCNKKHDFDDEVKNVTLNISLKVGETYTIDLSQYGDADDIASIYKQATAYDISEIKLNNAHYIYSFMKNGTTKTGVADTETVQLKVSEPAGRKHCEETNVTINFTIQ